MIEPVSWRLLPLPRPLQRGQDLMFYVPCPDGGKQPSTTPKKKINMSPSQKLGVATSKKVPPRIARSRPRHVAPLQSRRMGPLSLGD